jgi:hypothetical protein
MRILTFVVAAAVCLTPVVAHAQSKKPTPKPATEGPHVTKEPVNNGGGAKAECSAGYYVSAIQIVKDGDPTQQRSINVWCTLLPKR